MSKKTYIYGASDDLIEIDGAIVEEYGTFSQNIRIVASDGTQAIINYDGEWGIDVENYGDKYLSHVKSVGDDNEHEGELAKFTSYSDILILDEGVKWVKIGRKTFKETKQ